MYMPSFYTLVVIYSFLRVIERNGIEYFVHNLKYFIIFCGYFLSEIAIFMYGNFLIKWKACKFSRNLRFSRFFDLKIRY